MNIDKTGQNNQTTTFNTSSANAGSRTYQLYLQEFLQQLPLSVPGSLFRCHR